jgi:TRAP-type mannitol/chloroaromatic compound transport system permease large subunit
MARILGGTAVPVVAVPLLVMGADPIWLAVMIAMVLQTFFLTPPYGFALFYLRGVVTFIGLQLLAVALIWFTPSFLTQLPSLLHRKRTWSQSQCPK